MNDSMFWKTDFVEEVDSGDIPDSVEYVKGIYVRAAKLNKIIRKLEENKNCTVAAFRIDGNNIEIITRIDGAA